MNFSPAASRSFRFVARQHAGVGGDDHLHPVDIVAGLELAHDGHDGAGFGVVSFETSDLQGKSGAVDEQPDDDLRVDPALLGVADLTELVFLLRFEIQGVGWTRGAVAALLLLRFPGPPAEPAVRLSTQRALHDDGAGQAAMIGS